MALVTVTADINRTLTTIPHGHSSTPVGAIPLYLPAGVVVWSERAPDATNLYMRASKDVEDVVLLLDVTSSGSVGTTGSIFSMTGPGGAAAPIVAYDFTKFDPALTIAQNLTAANQSGNASYDLTAVGSGQINFLTISGGVAQSPYPWRPFACRSDGGALIGGGGTDFAETGAVAGIQITGALTVEWLGYVTEIPGAGGDAHLFLCVNTTASEVEADNVLYDIFWDGTANAWRYLHENAGGTDNFLTLYTVAAATPRLQIEELLSIPTLFTLTRSGSDGTVKLYQNGGLVAAGQIAATAFPTGGGSSKLKIGVGSDPTVDIATLGFRVFNVALTPAQVLESYRKTFFGVTP